MPDSTKWAICRPIGGISLNGLEYAIDPNNEPLLFDSQDDAIDFLIACGYTKDTSEDEGIIIAEIDSENDETGESAAMPDNTCIACGAIIPEGRHICLNCERENDMQTFRPRIRTNGDRIRAMSNRELAELISKGAPYCKRVSGIVPVCSGGRDCIDCVREWLESEVQS